MAVSHVYNQTVADGTATSVVRPSDWNSAHNQFLTLSGNTAGQSTVSGTNVVFQGGNNITLSASTAAGAATVVVSAANGGGGAAIGMSTIGNSSGTTNTYTSGTYVFAGGNNITLSQSGSTLTISAPSGGGIGASNLGNTFGSTGAISDRMVFAGSGGIQLSQSTDVQSATMTIRNMPMSQYPFLPMQPTLSRSVVSGTSGAGSTSAAFYVCPFVLPADLHAQEIEFYVSNGAFSAGTGSATIGYHLGFYTNNAGTLSQVSSFSAALRLSVNSATAVTAQSYWGSNSTNNSTQTSGNISAAWITGIREAKVYDSAFTLPANTYYAMVCITQRSSSVNVAASHMTIAEITYNRPAALLLATTTGAPSPGRIMGTFTSQMTGGTASTLSMSMPQSVNTTQITQTHSSGYASFIPFMYN